MTRNLIVVLLSLALLVAASGTVIAQGDQDPQLGQLRHEMERTDELIAYAREAVRTSNSAIAAQALDRAEKLQVGAREAYDNRAYLLALSLTRKAREQASLAISNSRLSEQLEGVVLSRLERAREMLERAREALPTPMGSTAEIILEQGRNNLAQAWQFYRQRRFKASVKLVEQVEQAARRLTSIARLSQQAGESFQYRLENVKRLLEYARDLLSDCDSEVGQEHLRHAEDAARMAREFHTRNQPRAALLALGQAREAARRAARECQDGERLQQRYEHLMSEFDRTTERLRVSTVPVNDAARKLLEQVREQLDLSRKYLAENQTESAQLSLQAAQLALRQAQRYIAGGR